MLFKLVAIFFVLFMNSSTAHADTVGLSWYTYHHNTAERYELNSDDYWYGKKRFWNNKTRGLYYVKDTGTPLLGDNTIVGYYCNSYSTPEHNRSTMDDGRVWVMYVQQSKCNVTTHIGKVFTLAGGRGEGHFWDVSATVELFDGYKQNMQDFGQHSTIIPIHIHNKVVKMDAFIAPVLSVRLGYVRMTLVGRGDVNAALEYNFK